ncbi:MAG: Putative ribosomal pseudouridine synthase [uncultured Sulfurovum sp.]|uniref:RNA pseudouridylate synthase n=1 Tax=uncultured Sulfurovum sp. TaxID=269237 RepID=A0A6S6TVR2_9BACT|nr:MAG: Putative ribosomal pseudouridine synthase [uncultured Sulfurovum sp.]
MPFVKRPFQIEKPMKAFLFIMRQFNFTQGEAQRLVAKGRVIIKGESIYDTGAIIEGEIEVVYFEPKSRGVKPIFVDKNFLVFDKPSGVLVHPNTMATEYSMLDEVRTHSGQNANGTHRIDMETSGLFLASRHKDAERFLKGSFEKKTIQKHYLAWVTGKLTEPFTVEESICVRNDYSTKKHKVEICKDGKKARTDFIPLEYDEELDTTLVECKPYTGRLHQIRIHLFHVKHPIFGDPIYGTSFEASDKYLDMNISEEERYIETGATRLLLHAHALHFPYGNNYSIFTKVDFTEAKKEICGKEERKFYT